MLVNLAVEADGALDGGSVTIKPLSIMYLFYSGRF